MFKFFSFNSLLNNISILILMKDSNLVPIGIWRCGIHRFRKDLQSQNKWIFKRLFPFIIVFKLADSSHASFACSMGFPCGVVSTWIRIIQLKSSHLIISCIHKTHSERSAWSELSINMFFIAEKFHKLFYINRFMIWI